ncbi:hypothetical protein EVAR_51513_1 [Eumeta japonica]|uniref:SCAN domain-containing protein 3 n=1 Tax=Eumeta variegata TaxID=151549 RepID=A0A4C1XCY3_EUMVA|nr:hypothetical protein EVAR_51513_1 [Eumeta japonica]
MSSDVESFLCDYLRTTHFSIQLDESILPGNEALLVAYVRFVMGEEIHEELLFAKTLKTDTKAFLGKLKFMKENIGWREFSQFSNLSQVACLDEDIQTFDSTFQSTFQHLIALYDDFKFRFEDILSMDIPPWIINPFDETEVDYVISQEELLELSTNKELQVTFKRGYQKL